MLTGQKIESSSDILLNSRVSRVLFEWPLLGCELLNELQRKCLLNFDLALKHYVF